ncbi:hypothetical protein [Nocardioides nanhaiensis]|uniref:OmpA-like domain-containing protein n=1 Tax=Nocardioides nanhaiensis TaxID=1476871 RepID=A0ABP8X2A5_9ACTN
MRPRPPRCRRATSAAALLTALLVLTPACADDQTRTGGTSGGEGETDPYAEPETEPDDRSGDDDEGDEGDEGDDVGLEEEETEALLAMPGVADAEVVTYAVDELTDRVSRVEMELDATTEQVIAVLEAMGESGGAPTLTIGPGAVNDPPPGSGTAALGSLGETEEQRFLMVSALVEARDLLPEEIGVYVSQPLDDGVGLPDTGDGLERPVLEAAVDADDAAAVVEPARLLLDSGLLGRVDSATVSAGSVNGSSTISRGILTFGGHLAVPGLDEQALAAYERLARVRGPLPWVERSRIQVDVYRDQNIDMTLPFDVADPPQLDRRARARAEEALWRAALPGLDALATLPRGSRLHVYTSGGADDATNPLRDAEVLVSVGRGAETPNGDRRPSALSERAEAYLRERGAVR